MLLEKQVCSLEQSKKLKKLGIVQDANFFWGKDLKGKRTLLSIKDIMFMERQRFKDYVIPKTDIKHYLKKKIKKSDSHEIYAAYTVAELGVMLPEYYPSWRFTHRQTDTYHNQKLSSSKKDVRWISTVIIKDKVKDGKTVTTANEFDRYEDTEAKSRARLLISLLEVGVIKASEVNKRLVEK